MGRRRRHRADAGGGGRRRLGPRRARRARRQAAAPPRRRPRHRDRPRGARPGTGAAVRRRPRARPGRADLRDIVRDATGGRGLAVAFDFAGVPAVRDQALGTLGKRGRLVLVGLGGSPVTIAHDTLFSYLRQQVLGHYGSEPEHVEQLVRLVEQGRLDLAESISDVLPLADAPQAVERLVRKEGAPIRLVLRP
ncbi:zinc-binding dehydrogenase [Actinomadura sp. CNU-125]|uniref:zinc-binding dehydrogenase n=1 Tax=Actinomadura sp. CNU-125 TaxID=1904961 RepID=UPI0021CCAD0E|nr:zinc-binding dehydrogenase [Actinomadura sp. CNU-125]